MTQQLIVKARADDVQYGVVLIRLNVRAIIHASMFFKLCQYFECPAAVTTLHELHNAGPGMHAAGKKYKAAESCQIASHTYGSKVRTT